MPHSFVNNKARVEVYCLFRSTELDNNWSWFQLRCMQVGGNANAVSSSFSYPINMHCISSSIKTQPLNLAVCISQYCSFLCAQMGFFRQHGCTTNDTNAKYNSRAAQMYREKIRQLANAALSKYGTEVCIRTSFCSSVITAQKVNYAPWVCCQHSLLEDVVLSCCLHALKAGPAIQLSFKTHILQKTFYGKPNTILNEIVL